MPSGSYSLELSQQLPEQNEVKIFSNDIIVNESPGSSKGPESGTAFIFTGFTSIASSTESLAAGSTSTSSIPASGHSSSFASVITTVTPPSNTAALPASSLQPLNVQHVSLVHNPISNGTVVGIVIGVVLFFILTIASATLCWRRRRRSSQPAVSELPAHPTDNDHKSDPAIWIPELDQEGAVYGPHELADTPTPMAQSLRSLEVTESYPAEGRVSEMAQSLRSLEVTETQPAEGRVSEMPETE